jgi:hypothetical protein
MFVSVAACWLISCSPSPSDDSDASSPDADTVAAQPALPPSPDVDASSANGAAAISFNAAQTTDSDAWFTQVDGSGACGPNVSPAEAVARLQALGASPTSLDTNAEDGTLSQVVVSLSDGHGPRSTTYYRKLGDCQTDLPSEQAVPDQYK